MNHSIRNAANHFVKGSRHPWTLLAGLLLVFCNQSLHAQPSNTPTEILLTFSARNHKVVKPPQGVKGVSIREEKGLKAGEGVSFSPGVGKPDLGFRMIDVLLPYDADLETLNMEYHVGPDAGPLNPILTYLGRFYVRPAGPNMVYDLETGKKDVDIPEGIQLDAHGHDMSVYFKGTYWPYLPLTVIRSSRLRQYRSIRLAFSPFLWNTANGILLKLENLNVTLRWKKKQVDPKVMEWELSDPMKIKDLDEKYYNFEVAKAWYFPQFGFRNTEFDYIIITTDLYEASSMQLEAFKKHKKGQGYSVGVFTVEDIGGLYSHAEVSDRIRAFLEDRHCEWGIHYVLLIGNPDPYDQFDQKNGIPDTVGEVPMKMAWPRGGGWASKKGGWEACPTDHYYADLSSYWDWDFDGYPGEWVDDVIMLPYSVDIGDITIVQFRELRGIDYDSEVLVGRIPFATVAEADMVLEATIKYQAAELTPNLEKARKRVYIAMSHFNEASDTSYLGNQILFESTHPAGLTNFTFYQPDAHYTGTFDLENEALINQWTAKGAGLVAWTGHGTWTYTDIRYDHTDLMASWDTPSLNSFPRAYVVQGSCKNGYPEYAYNLGACLLATCSVGTFSGTRNSWYGKNRTTFGDKCRIQDIVWHITSALADKLPAGYALSLMRSRGNPNFKSDSQNLITYNLYGDPSGRYKYE